MKKKFLLVCSILFLAQHVSSHNIFVNTTSEWQQGDSNKILASSDRIYLESDVPVSNWSQDQYNNNVKVEEILIDSQYIYTASSSYDESGHLTKMRAKNGSVIWQKQYGVGGSGLADDEWTSIVKGGDGYLYSTERFSGLYRLDGSGNLNPKGDFPVGEENGRVLDVKWLDGYLYVSGSSGILRKIDPADASEEWERNVDSLVAELEAYNDSTLLIGGLNEVHMVDAESGDVLNSRNSDVSGSVDGIERGPEGNVWAGTNDGVLKLSPNLQNSLCKNFNYNDDVKALDSYFGGVIASDAVDQKFNKLDSDCNVVWEDDPSLNNYYSLETKGKAYYAGGETGSKGVIEQFIKEYYPWGNHSSKDYGLGSENISDQAEINVSLNGNPTSFNFEWTETGSFTPSDTQSQEYSLGNGINTIDLPDKHAKAARFDFNLTSQSGNSSPEVFWTNITFDNINTEITSPPNKTWQTSNFDVNVSDSSSATSCGYKFYDGGWPASWQSRTCDGTVSIDLTSPPCDENGYNECKVRVQARNGAATDTETHFYHTFNSSRDCTGGNLSFCYPFEEGSGQVAYDYSGGEHHASIGKTFSPDSADPVWINDNSKCYRGNCLYFEDEQLRLREDDVPDFDEFSFTGVVNLSSSDNSPDTILLKEEEIKLFVAEDADKWPYFGANPENKRNLSANIYNSTVCGGWCGTEPVGDTEEGVISDIQVPQEEEFRFKINWNGTHFGFFHDEKSEFISPPSVDRYTAIEQSSSDMLLSSRGESKPFNLSGIIDEYNLYNLSEGGTIPGSFYCVSSKPGSYKNIGEQAEFSGRIKNDREYCTGYDGDKIWFDQDFGDVNGDGIQDTCREARGYNWISKSEVWSNPQAYTGGIDDSWNEFMQSLEDANRFSSNQSRPEDPSLAVTGSDISPVDTGFPSRNKVATIGFCAGDDYEEHTVTQVCQSNLCSTDRDVLGVAQSPDSCVLSPDVEGNSETERKLYKEGESVELELSTSERSIACFNGNWFDEWPVAITQGSAQVALGDEEEISFQLINVNSEARTFTLSKEGDLSRFMEFEGDASDGQVSVDGRSSKTITATLDGVKLSTGETIRIQAVSQENQNSGSDSISVDVVENTGRTGLYNDVPGIGGIQIVFIMILSSFYYLFIRR